MRKVTFWKKMPIIEFENIVKRCFSVAHVLRELGFSCSGGVHKEVSDYIKKNGISTSHFKKPKTVSKYKKEDIFLANSTVSRHVVKRFILRDNMLKNECSECQKQPFWRNKPLVMILDHKNGINNDNRIENLRFLCPDCNSQTDTFAGKNVNKDKNDAKELDKKRHEIIEMYAQEKKKVKESKGIKIPKEKNVIIKKVKEVKMKTIKPKQVIKEIFVINKDELEKVLTKTRSFVKTGEFFGCSDHTIKKKCIKMNIDYKSIFSLENKKEEMAKFYKESNNLQETAKNFNTSVQKLKAAIQKTTEIKKPAEKIKESQKKQIKVLRSKGYTIREIADKLNVSTMSVKRYK